MQTDPPPISAESPIFTAFTLHFGVIVDDRVLGRISYPLPEILYLILVSKVCGAADWHEVVDFGNANLAYLRLRYPYKNGIPAHDTIERVLGLIKPSFFQKAFIAWVAEVFKLPTDQIMDHIAVDGKAVINSATKANRNKKKKDGGDSGAFIVNAWSSVRGVCLGQLDITDKKSETKGAIELLELIDIQGHIISADANFCTKAVTSYIDSEGGFYMIGLKGNRKTLKDHVINAFAVAKENGQITSSLTTYDKDHGRVETREISVLKASEHISEAYLTTWASIACIIMVTTEIFNTASKKTENATRYYVSNLPADTPIAKLLGYIRSHWGIENNLHYMMDVYFGEDSCTMKNKAAVVNRSAINKMALNLLKKEDSPISIKRKQKKAIMLQEFRDKVLGF